MGWIVPSAVIAKPDRASVTTAATRAAVTAASAVTTGLAALVGPVTQFAALEAFFVFAWPSAATSYSSTTLRFYRNGVNIKSEIQK